jgi:hypothetical protein
MTIAGVCAAFSGLILWKSCLQPWSLTTGGPRDVVLVLPAAFALFVIASMSVAVARPRVAPRLVWSTMALGIAFVALPFSIVADVSSWRSVELSKIPRSQHLPDLLWGIGILIGLGSFGLWLRHEERGRLSQAESRARPTG